MARPVKGRSRPTISRSHVRSHTAPSVGAPASPEAQARLPELLTSPPEADVVARFSALAAETPGGPLALIEALGGSRVEAAGRVVAAIAVAAPDREQRKAARRALHKLRSAGISV